MLHPGLKYTSTVRSTRGEERRSKFVHQNTPSCDSLDVLEDECPEKRLKSAMIEGLLSRVRQG